MSGNRASADPSGRPWSERKRWVWWDEGEGRWVGYDVPDFAPTKAPGAAGGSGTGLDALSGTDPFIMMSDGKGWLYVPTWPGSARYRTSTEQNGQMLGTVVVSLIRSSCARARAGARFAPSAASPPSAVAAPPE